MLKEIIQKISDYKQGEYAICDELEFSPYRINRRILLYKNQYYTSGKYDSQGNYKYWFDIIQPRVDSEIKNIDFDTKDISLASLSDNDTAKLILANARLQQYLQETGQAEKLNEAVERGSEWGNVVWKKLKNSYKIMNLYDLYVLNPIAETLEDSDVIEHQVMSVSDIRKMKDVWTNTDKLTENVKENKLLHVYEYNGEMTKKQYNEAKGELGGGDEYVLGKVIVGGAEEDAPTEILYCEYLEEKPYIEYHRGKFSGRWLRVGMYEVLFDIQTRCNQIGNQIATGLEWASKTIFRSSDKVIAQNILTDLDNGDVIKSQDLAQVQTRMEGFDQLIADWNRLIELANSLTNSYEIITGESSPSGTPFRLGALQNQNANKLYDFIREKLSLSLQELVNDWILPELLKDLKVQDAIELSGDDGALTRYYQMLIDAWYVQNLFAFPPHGQEEAQAIKMSKLDELLKNDKMIVKLNKEMWKGFKPRAIVVISGENYNLASDLETLHSFIQLEADPVRRSALIEMAMKKKNIDISKLPKTQEQVPVRTGQKVE